MTNEPRKWCRRPHVVVSLSSDLCAGVYSALKATGDDKAAWGAILCTGALAVVNLVFMFTVEDSR